MNSEQDIEKIRALLKEGEENQKSQKALLERIINKKIVAPHELYTELLGMHIRQLQICLEIAALAWTLENMHIEVITDWTIADLTDAGGA